MMADSSSASAAITVFMFSRCSVRWPADPAVLPSPRSMRSFSSVIRASRAFSSVWMMVPIWSSCLVKLASAFAAEAALASFC
jgi:hypothetical protein